MKYLLIFSLFLQNLFSNEQIIFVLAENFSAPTAKLLRYEKINEIYQKVSEPINVNIGEFGLAWGISDYEFKQNIKEPQKKEGDKRAVAGVFALSKVFGYNKNMNLNIPYINSTEKHICVDDSSNKNYNQIITTENKKAYKSYENMLLSNETYEYVIKIEHNTKNEKLKGSCIFMHIENPNKKETQGCTSMKKDEILKIISWLDMKKKPILIQIPKSSCEEYKLNYSYIDCNL